MNERGMKFQHGWVFGRQTTKKHWQTTWQTDHSSINCLRLDIWMRHSQRVWHLRTYPPPHLGCCRKEPTGSGGTEERSVKALTSTDPHLAVRLVLDRIATLMATLRELRPLDDSDRFLLRPCARPLKQGHLGCPEADAAYLQAYRPT